MTDALLGSSSGWSDPETLQGILQGQRQAQEVVLDHLTHPNRGGGASKKAGSPEGPSTKKRSFVDIQLNLRPERSTSSCCRPSGKRSECRYLVPAESPLTSLSKNAKKRLSGNTMATVSLFLQVADLFVLPALGCYVKPEILLKHAWFKGRGPC